MGLYMVTERPRPFERGPPSSLNQQVVVLASVGFTVLWHCHPRSLVEVAVIMVVANIYCNLPGARHCSEHFARINLFSFSVFPLSSFHETPSPPRGAQKDSLSPWVGKPGSDPTPGSPKHNPLLASLCLPGRDPGGALRPEPLHFYGPAMDRGVLT